MKLTQYQNLPRRLNKVNSMLSEQYGFVVSQKGKTLSQMRRLREAIGHEVADLKARGYTVDGEALSKRLLVKEAISICMAMRIGENGLCEGVGSDQYRNVVGGLAKMIVQLVNIGDDLESASDAAMREYRASELKFPVDQVEYDAIGLAESNLRDQTRSDLDELPLDEAPFTLVPKDVAVEKPYSPNGNAFDEYIGRGVSAKLSKDQSSMADKILGNVELSLEPISGTPHSKASTFGKPMTIAHNLKEMAEMRTNYVKTLRVILESEVSQAEVMIATKGFSQDLQEMSEKIGRLQNERLPPLVDQMIETYGVQAARHFHTETTASLTGIMMALSSAREQLNLSVIAMANDQIGNVDMDDDFDLESAERDAEDATADEFGSADVSEPLGRPRLESAQPLIKRIQEMRTILDELKASRVKK